MPEFVSAIGRFSATALVVGSMIGAGVYIVPADMIRQVHAPSLFLVAWFLGGLVTVFGAITFSELGAMFPRAGGLYVYLREGISPLFGFLYGWTLMAVIWSGGIAAAAVGFARFCGVLIPSLTPDVFLGGTLSLPTGPIEVGLSRQRLVAVGSVVVLTWINVRGVRSAARIQNVLSTLKFAAVAGITILGLTIGRQAVALATNFGPGFWPKGGLHWSLLPALAAAMVGSIFTLDGWYSPTFAAGEMKNPKRDLPFALIAGTLTVTVLFVFTNLAYLSALPAEAIASAPQDRVATAALEAMFGEIGAYLMAGVIVVSAFGLNNGLILGGGRIYYAMARDGLFFESFGELHPRFRTPVRGLVLQCAWISVLCLSGTYSQLIDYVTFASVLFWVLVGIGLFALRIRRPDAERPVRAWGYPLVPALFVAAAALVALNLVLTRPQYTGPGILFVALGVPLYFWQERRKVSRSRASASDS